jgi:hypothetical protein
MKALVPIVITTSSILFVVTVYIIALRLRRRTRHTTFRRLYESSCGLKTDRTSFNHIGDFELSKDGLYITYNRRGKTKYSYMINSPVKFESIRVDGSRLMGMDKNRRIWTLRVIKEHASKDGYFYKELPNSMWSQRFYTIPLVKGLYPKNTFLPECKKWTVSNCSSFAENFTVDGKVYNNMNIGTTSLHLLMPNHILIYDPWVLNPRTINLPTNDSFDNMDVSGSTIFIMKESPLEMYTVFCDLTLIIEIKKVDKWRKQPNMTLSGLATATSKNLTIVQTGKNNENRELRVNGTDSLGNSGYYKKMIYSTEWEFVSC